MTPPLGWKAGEVGERLKAHSWCKQKKGFPTLNRGPSLQSLELGAVCERCVSGGWRHLQPECGNQLLKLSEAVGRHGNSGRP